MVKFIAHRGNTNGSTDQENQNDYLLDALNKGHMVEADVILYNDKLHLGHDEPQELISQRLLENTNVIFHAKNLQALTALMDKNLHCFWHQEDTVTITNQGYIWCYPGIHPAHRNSIWLDLHNKKLPKIDPQIYAICGDYEDIIK